MDEPSAPTIVQAETPEDYADFAALIREYFDWMFARYGDMRGFIEAVGGHQGVEAELVDLAATYGPPAGRTFIARVDGQAAGCIASKARGAGTTEMKRLFVPERFQGRGLGRALTRTLLAQAREDGFARMVLDTGFQHDEAMSMYESLGFRPCEPYLDYPAELLPHLRFFERDL